MDAIFLTDNGDTSHFFNTEKYAPSTSFNLTPLSQPMPTTKYLGRKNRLKAEGWRLEGEPCEMITKTSAFNLFYIINHKVKFLRNILYARQIVYIRCRCDNRFCANYLCNIFCKIICTAQMP